MIKHLLTVLLLKCLTVVVAAHPMTFTVDFNFTNLTDGFGGPPDTGGLLYIQADRGTGFSGPAPGAFVTGDDFRLVENHNPVFDPPITISGNYGPGTAYIAFTGIASSGPLQFTDLNGEVYPSGSFWRFIYFPSSTGLNPSSPASAITSGMPYAISDFVFTVPSSPNTFSMLDVDSWQWFFIPEPHQLSVVILLFLFVIYVLQKRFLKKLEKPIHTQ